MDCIAWLRPQRAKEPRCAVVNSVRASFLFYTQEPVAAFARMRTTPNHLAAGLRPARTYQESQPKPYQQLTTTSQPPTTTRGSPPMLASTHQSTGPRQPAPVPTMIAQLPLPTGRYHDGGHPICLLGSDACYAPYPPSRCVRGGCYRIRSTSPSRLLRRSRNVRQARLPY